MQLGDLDARLDAQGCVEIGQRLVEQEHLGLAHDGAADGDALALAAGELRRLAVEQRLELEDLCGLRTSSRISALGRFASFRPKAMLSKTFICG